MSADDAWNASSAHAVEEFFLNDLAVFNSVETRLVKVHALPCHWPGFGGDVVFKAHDEAVAMRPWPFHLALVHSVVFLPPLGFRFDGGDAFLPSGSRGTSLRFDAHDFRAVQGTYCFRFFAFATKLNQLLSYFQRTAHICSLRK